MKSPRVLKYRACATETPNIRTDDCLHKYCLLQLFVIKIIEIGFLFFYNFIILSFFIYHRNNGFWSAQSDNQISVKPYCDFVKFCWILFNILAKKNTIKSVKQYKLRVTCQPFIFKSFCYRPQSNQIKPMFYFHKNKKAKP